MANRNLESLETEIYAIADNLKFKRAVSIENAFNSRPTPILVVRKEYKGQTKSLFNDDYFIHSKYTFYDETLDVSTMNISDWVLLKATEPQNRSREMLYSIADPLGEVRNLSNIDLNPNNKYEYFHIEGVCKIIELLRNISKYPDWSYYDLMEENILLKKRIEILEKERDEQKG
jgi:hypothetical protein